MNSVNSKVILKKLNRLNNVSKHAQKLIIDICNGSTQIRPVYKVPNKLTVVNTFDELINILMKLNEGLRDQLIKQHIPFNLKIEIHSIILNLLLYPNTLVSFLPQQQHNPVGVKEIINTLIIIIIKNNLVGDDLKKFLIKIKDSGPHTLYFNLITNLLHSQSINENIDHERDTVNLNNLLEPILEYIQKNEYKKVLAPLIDTIIYNNKVYQNTNLYLRNTFYKQ